MTKGLFVTELDVAYWLGFVCASLAMISFCWGLVRGIASVAVFSLLLPISLTSGSSILPEIGVALMLLLAAIVPAPKRQLSQPSSVSQTGRESSREEEPVLQ